MRMGGSRVCRQIITGMTSEIHEVTNRLLAVIIKLWQLMKFRIHLCIICISLVMDYLDLDLFPHVTRNPQAVLKLLNTQITHTNSYDEVQLFHITPSFFSASVAEKIERSGKLYGLVFIKQCCDVLWTSPMFHRCLRTEPTPPPYTPTPNYRPPGRYSFIHLIIL